MSMTDECYPCRFSLRAGDDDNGAADKVGTGQVICSAAGVRYGENGTLMVELMGGGAGMMCMVSLYEGDFITFIDGYR